VPRSGTVVVCGSARKRHSRASCRVPEFWTRNACLELSSTDDRTTPAQAAPAARPSSAEEGIQNVQSPGTRAPHAFESMRQSARYTFETNYPSRRRALSIKVFA
jgi:hypothetical protein